VHPLDRIKHSHFEGTANQVRIVAMIESPYVVALLQRGISGAGTRQRFWLTMPLLNGVSLDKVLPR